MSYVCNGIIGRAECTIDAANIILHDNGSSTNIAKRTNVGLSYTT
jgi:hypothetical protein